MTDPPAGGGNTDRANGSADVRPPAGPSRGGLRRPAFVAAAHVVLLGVAGLFVGAGRSSRTGTPVRDLSVTGLYIREPTGGRAGMFLTIRNDADQPRTLTSIYTGAARDELVHAHPGAAEPVVPADDGPLVVPAGGVVVLAPTGRHIMLGRLFSPLRPGDRISILLTFSDSNRLLLTAPVLAAEALPPTGPAS